MGVFIKDINKPQYCWECPCHNGENGTCNLLGISICDEIPEKCPLVEVPTPHGRLIDVKDIMYECNTARIRAGDSFITRTYVDNMPTIIEEEE